MGRVRFKCQGYCCQQYLSILSNTTQWVPDTMAPRPPGDVRYKQHGGRGSPARARQEDVHHPSSSYNVHSNFDIGWFGIGWFGICWFGIGWFGIGWFGIGWFVTGWLGIGWFGIGRFGIGWLGIGWFGIGRLGIGWFGIGWFGINWYGIGWFGIG